MITFTMLDQTLDKEVAVNVRESFISDPNWPNFQRPSTTINNDMLGFGFPKFVSLDMLAKRQYVKNDTICIKAEADSDIGILV